MRLICGLAGLGNPNPVAEQVLRLAVPACAHQYPPNRLSPFPNPHPTPPEASYKDVGGAALT